MISREDKKKHVVVFQTQPGLMQIGTQTVTADTKSAEAQARHSPSMEKEGKVDRETHPSQDASHSL